jgi:hypothetical protein
MRRKIMKPAGFFVHDRQPIFGQLRGSILRHSSGLLLSHHNVMLAKYLHIAVPLASINNKMS